MNPTVIVHRVVLASCVAAAAALPAGALGQTTQATVAGVESNQTADEIHDKAAALYTDPAQHGQAAHLLRQECELRSPEDPLTFRCLSMSARLFYYAGELLDARRMMEKAAKNALQRGDVMAAAQSYLEAASIARKQKSGDSKVAELVQRARNLSFSPLLTENQRGWILAKIEAQDPELASIAED